MKKNSKNEKLLEQAKINRKLAREERLSSFVRLKAQTFRDKTKYNRKSQKDAFRKGKYDD